MDKYDCIDTDWEYRREGIETDTETLASEKTNVKFMLLQILMT
jgi:hypothetical protein